MAEIPSLSPLKPRRRHAWWLVGLAGVVLAAILFVRERATEARLLRADPDAISADRGLNRFAISRGTAIFRTRCAGCHGNRGTGDPRRGVPDLTDQDWLYGAGKVSDIERVVDYGIRAHNPKGWNLAIMPALGTANPGGEKGLKSLSPGDIEDVIDFLMLLEHRPHDPTAAARGAVIYSSRGACYDCHGADAQGDTAIGAPNLADNIWIYGDGGRAAIFQSLAQGRQGVCPAWIGKLSPTSIRAVAVYVHSLSQGRPAARSGD